MKIKFFSDQEVEAQGEVVQRFKAGEVYELSLISARRWIRRQVAEEVQGKKPGRPKSKPKVEKPAEPEKPTEPKTVPHKSDPLAHMRGPSK